MIRSFCKHLHELDFVVLDQEESHHLVTVLRSNKGTKIELIDGNGTLAEGFIAEADKKSAKIVTTKKTTTVRPLKTISLVQASLANNKTDFVIREACAISVNQICILQSDRSESKIKNKVDTKLAHWEKISIGACKQSGNLFLPKITFVDDVQNIPIQSSSVNIFGDMEKSSEILLNYLKRSDSITNICMVIGPEGDFSDREKIFLRENNFTGCRLSKTILRAETAAIYSLSVIDNYLNSIC